MSKRYEWINGETYCDSDQMYDNETGNKTQPVYVADLLNEQDQKIKDLEAKLEEQLKKKPKYNIGDRVYIINEDYEVERDFIESIDIDTDGIEYYTEMYSIC